MILVKKKAGVIERINMMRPFNAHAHPCDIEVGMSVGFIPPSFGGAIVMPNRAPLITTVNAAREYCQQIIGSQGSRFKPLTTLCLSKETTIEEILRADNSRCVVAAMYFMESGIALENFDVLLAKMEEVGLPFILHRKAMDYGSDLFDREKVFIDTVLLPLVCRFPRLKVSFEQVATREGVAFVESAPNVVATITAQHLLLDHNVLFREGLGSSYRCLPTPKQEEHRQSLIRAATSGSPKFFLGTDSALCSCEVTEGVEPYAKIFDEHEALDKLEGFASRNGPEFYGLPVMITDTVTLIKVYGETVRWRLSC